MSRPKKKRNRRHLLQQLADVEHALAFVIGSAGRYAGEHEKMPSFLQKDFHDLCRLVWKTNTHYATWLVESNPNAAPDFLLEQRWPWSIVDPKDPQLVWKPEVMNITEE